MKKTSQTPDYLPPIEQLLIAGGDARLALDPLSGRNKYGCRPSPEPLLLAFGSSTASGISTQGYADAGRLRQKLLKAIAIAPLSTVYTQEMQRIRMAWLQLCELSDLTGLKLIFSPSGTDAHAIAAQYAVSGASALPLIIMMEANETGSGVAPALSETSATGTQNIELAQIAIRLNDGSPRPSAAIDAEVENLVGNAAASDRRVLLILIDQSKTGLIAPSPACAIALHRRYPDNVEVLVDACQFRIAIPTLRAYLEQGFTVALTGSKFLAAPSFSAVLLLPSAVAERLQNRAFPRKLLPCSSQADWPADWNGAEHLAHTANFGLLLRCGVALEELRRFRTVPETVSKKFLQTFAEAIQQRLASDPHFEPLPTLPLDRRPLIAANSWDHLQTIFPFLLYQSLPSGRIPLSSEQTLNIYRLLQSGLPNHSDNDNATTRYQLGQPVACGTRNGIAVSALRLCISSRLIIEATADSDKGNTIIKNALTALNKTAQLIRSSQ